ncbi:MAG: sensor histidine kinase [Pirellula sp.]
MTLQRIPWSLGVLPIACVAVGAFVVWLVDQHNENLWKQIQVQVAADEMQIYKSIADSSLVDMNTFTGRMSDSRTGHLSILDEKQLSPSEIKRLENSSRESSVEPGGYVRLRLIEKLKPSLSDESIPVQGPAESRRWIAYTKRLPPFPSSNTHWTPWWLFSTFMVGLAAALSLRSFGNTRQACIRSLQQLRSQTSKTRSRDEMIKLFPGSYFNGEMNREIIALIEAYQNQIITVKTGAEQSETVLSAMPVGILAFTSDLQLWFANRAGIDLLDLSDRIRDRTRLIELIRQPRVLELITESQKTSQTMDCELDGTTKSIVLRLRAHPLQHESPQSDPSVPPPMLLVITDETRIKQLENVRRDFTANVSHELKTPLAAIKAYAETLLMGALDDPDARELFITRISEQADRLDRLIFDLLQLTRIQSLPEKLQLIPLSLQDLARTCIEDHQAIAKSKNITIYNEIADSTPRVLADHESLRTILGNLLSNAVRYSKTDGYIRVSSKVVGPDVELSVIDYGIGIPEEDIDRIFERFYRVEKARTQDAGGTGLGLAIVKHLTQALGGTVSVRSTFGKGSQFTVRLKTASESDLAQNEQTNAAELEA